MFGAKRKARKIGQDEEDSSADIRVSGSADDGEESSLAVTRSSSTSRSSSKAKRKSTALRTSFGPGGTSMTEGDDDDDGATAVFTPKKSSLSRQALEKNALRKGLAAAIQSEQMPLRQTEDRPSYSADALNELKSSTPSTPKDLRTQTDIVGAGQDLAGDAHTKELDLAAKFGSDLAFTKDSTIPTDAEIREKKERRARLAKEHDYIGLNDDGDDRVSEDSDDEFRHRSVQRYDVAKASKYEENRLVRDDEDIAEGFDNFVEDGRIALGRKAEKEQKKRHEAEMREMIEKAEGSDESSDDESEVERRAAYEAAQTRAGMDGLRKEEKGAKARRPRTPPKITPLPSLAGCAERLKGELERKRTLKEQKVRRLEEVRSELHDIAVRKEEVQRLLNEAGERYLRLRAEADKAAEKMGVEDEEAAGRDVVNRSGLGGGSGNMVERMTIAQADGEIPGERAGLGNGMSIGGI